MAINFTNFTSADNLADVAVAANQVTDNYFFPVLILAVFVIMFLASYKKGVRVSFAASSFVCVSLLSILHLNGLVDSWIWAAGLLVAASAVAVLFFSDS